MSITMSSMSISLVERITNEFHYKKGDSRCGWVSFYYVQREYDWNSVAPPPSDRFLVENASEKVVNCYGASSRRFDKEYFQSKTISNPSDAVFELIINPSSIVFYNENDFSSVINQARRVPSVPCFSLVYLTFIAVKS